MENLINTLSFGLTFNSVFFAFIGAILSLLIQATYRNVDSKRTPKKFNFYFLLKDNVFRFLASILSIYVCLVLPIVEIEGLSPNIKAFWIGFFVDKLIQLFNKKLHEKRELH